MYRDGLLTSIAETGYNVGFGAKKNFATHDIVRTAPRLIGYISLAVGVIALIFEPLNAKGVAAALVVLGIASVYITLYDHNKVEYAKEGERLTALFYQLRDLYRDVKASGDQTDLTAYRERFDRIQQEFLSFSQSDQIFLSDWYAHYKFFWQNQIEWIDEQKQFRFWRDKIPLSATLALISLAIASVGLVVWRVTPCLGG